MLEINKVFIGQDRLVRGVLTALLADGHVLIESVPGLGKTLLVRALGQVLGCAFNRIQFTPDLMPSDVTGSPIYDERMHDFRFRPGPVFTQLLLADEINRAPAKTHSALLEIMQENRVTIDGVNYPIEPPFLVHGDPEPDRVGGDVQPARGPARPVPVQAGGRLPERAGGGGRSSGCTPGTTRPTATWPGSSRAVTDPAEVLAMQRACAGVLVDDHVLGYIAALVRTTRQWPTFALGVSPRAGVAILRAARAVAALEGRDYVVPDDVQEVVLPRLAAPGDAHARGRGRGPVAG